MRIPRLAAPAAVGLTAAVAAFAVVALGTDGGGDREPRPLPTAAAAKSPGAAVFARMGCAGCHTLAAANANGRFGPDLDARLQDHTGESLTAQILSPRPGMGMPTNFGQRMSEAELEALVDFLLAARRSP
jgi:mono/diheme cytochrome c family protein